MTNMSFYTGDHPIVSSALNVHFDELLQMSDDAFAAWSETLAAFISDRWKRRALATCKFAEPIDTGRVALEELVFME